MRFGSRKDVRVVHEGAGHVVVVAVLDNKRCCLGLLSLLSGQATQIDFQPNDLRLCTLYGGRGLLEGGHGNGMPLPAPHQGVGEELAALEQRTRFSQFELDVGHLLLQTAD